MALSAVTAWAVGCVVMGDPYPGGDLSTDAGGPTACPCPAGGCTLPDLSLQWTTPYASPEVAYPEALAFGPDGDLFVVGLWGGQSTVTGTTWSYFVARFDSSGALRWWVTHEGAIMANSLFLEVAPDGGVVVAGAFGDVTDAGSGPTEPANGWGSFIAVYEPADGSVRWVENLVISGSARIMAMALDGAGDIYITGEFAGDYDLGGQTWPNVGAFDIFLVKLGGTNGSLFWTRAYGSPDMELAEDVAVDDSGGVFLTGSLNAPLDLGVATLFPDSIYSVFLLRVDPAAGESEWAVKMDGVAALRVSADCTGGAHWFGWMVDEVTVDGEPVLPADSGRGAILRFEPDGQLAWARSVLVSSGSILTAPEMRSDCSGRVTLLVATTNDIDFGIGPLLGGGGGFGLVQLAPDGEQEGAFGLPSGAGVPSLDVDTGGLDVDDCGRIGIAGLFAGEVDLGTGGMVAIPGEEDVTDLFVGRLAP